VLAATARPDGALGPATAAARRHGVVAGGLAVAGAVGAAAPTVVAGSDRVLLQTGRYLACLFVVAAIAHTLVLALGEVTWPRPTGPVRAGRLGRRGLGDVCPRWLLLIAVGLVAGAAVVLAAAAVLAEADGRSLTSSSRTADGGLASATASPFPGLFYGGPVLVALGVLVVLVWLTLRLVVHRPAVAGADHATDTALRRAGAHRVLRGCVAGIAMTLGPVLAVAGQAWHGVAGTAGLHQAAATGLVVVGAVTALAGAGVVLAPAPRVPASAPDPVAVPA